MGVMPCGRGNCPNVMCDRYIRYRGSYICYECMVELHHLKETWLPPLDEDEIKRRIDQFMETDTGSKDFKGIGERDRIFDSLFE